ncbi:hypothetical protein B0H17DRAFT_1146140 [Mycena rosella]|uniref:Uncharacterized protein n=1 Tax=Mycena rosella TaxID=1033263 RepID=A0AAD7CPG4_MYCRO|nr:hypothetical protein B0H17DRAFT_1146140 [Mycena rosella]
MPVAWLGLKARALAWLERAWAWISSGQSPSLSPGLGLAWLWPEPGLEDFGGLNPVYLFKISTYFRHVFDATCALWIIPLRASNFRTRPLMLRQSSEHARKGNNAGINEPLRHVYPSQGLRAWLGLENFQAKAPGPLKPDVGPGLAWPERAWLGEPEGLRPGHGHH